MRRLRSKRGFTLVELLVVIAIIAILIVLSFPLGRIAILHANCASCSSNMRSLGAAFMLYATDNGAQLPGRITTGDKWPTLLYSYVGQNTKAYEDPGDPKATALTSATLLSNGANGSSFFFNGFNDLGAYTNPNVAVALSNITNCSDVILLGQKISGAGDFYMDFVEDNEDQILNKTAYFGGSNYTFADGSVQWLPLASYNDKMWLGNQNYVIPSN